MTLPKAATIALTLGLFLSIWLTSCVSRVDNKPADGRKISNLTILHTTPQYVDDCRISALIRSQPGTVFDENRMDDDIKALWESGLVDDAGFLVKPDGNSVRLTAKISTRRGSGPGLFRGNRSFSDQTLWKQIRRSHADRIEWAVDRPLDPATQRPVVHTDGELVREVLPAVSVTLLDFYRRNGFVRASVRVEAWRGGPPTASDFVFIIDEGDAQAKAR